MPTARQIATQRKELRRSLERDRRAKDRKQLAALKGHVKHAKELKRQRMREVVISCRQARVRFRAVKKALDAKHKADVASARERERLSSRRNCDAAKDRARAKHEDRFSRATASLAAERAHQSQARIWARPARALPQRRAATSLQESDSQVAHNLPHDLLPVWRAVKNRIKGTPRRSRTEAFLEWAAEHRGEVQRIVTRQIDRDVEDLIKHEAELRARVVSPSHYRDLSDRELREAVPF